MNVESRFSKLLYAHRGANLRLPENTIEAFTEGLKSGANALELDVHYTTDDVVVVFHDDDGLRVAGEIEKIMHCPYESIKEWRLGDERNCQVPTFKEVIQSFPDVILNVDIKCHDETKVQLVVNLVNELGAQNRVRLASDNWRITRKISSLGYQGPVGMSTMEIALLYFLPEFVLRRFAWEGRAAQIPLKFSIFRLAKRKFIDKCHRLKIRVDYWVINDLQTAVSLFDLGADGIMTDDPATLRSSLAA